MLRPGRVVALSTAALILSACQSQETSPTYPDLRTVSSPSNTSYPLEERRQIVRDLIEDRDLAQHRKAVIRHRSGLSDIPPPAAPTPTEARAEDIIRSAPAQERDLDDEAQNDQSDRVYRDRAQFDDGTLDDFIRRLKQDTAPIIDDSPPADQQGPVAPSDEPKPQSWRFQGTPSRHDAAAFQDLDRPLVLSAFAPSAMQENEAAVIRLAASEDQGFLCTYLGWAVAWSTACLDDEGGSGSKDDEVVADAGSGEAENRASSSASEDLPDTGDDPGSDGDGVADPSRGAGEEGIGASEDLGGDSVFPVAGTLDRLRNLIRSRNSRSEGTSTDRRSLSYNPPELEQPAPTRERPLLPASRPEIEKDLQIVHHDHLFEFTRTPRPAFKPLPPESKTVIFPPETPRPEEAEDKVVFIPAARDTAGDLDEAEPESSEDELQPVTIDPGEPDGSLLLDSELILFDPGSAELPVGIETRLQAMLDDARANEGRLFIVSEASLGNLAMERARGVGLALVRMGATADLIEYDIVVDQSADHVQVLLKIAAAADPSESAGDAP